MRGCYAALDCGRPKILGGAKGSPAGAAGLEAPIGWL